MSEINLDDKVYVCAKHDGVPLLFRENDEGQPTGRCPVCVGEIADMQ